MKSINRCIVPSINDPLLIRPFVSYPLYIDGTDSLSIHSNKLDSADIYNGSIGLILTAPRSPYLMASEIPLKDENYGDVTFEIR